MGKRTDILRAAVYDADVAAAVEAATILERIELPGPEHVDHDPLVSNARIERPAEPADYVAAIHDHIDKFDGLAPADVTEASVAAVLPTEQEETA